MDYYGNREFGFSSLRQFLDIVIMIAELYAEAPLTVEWLLFHGADLIERACDILVQTGCCYKYCTYMNVSVVHALHAKSLIMWFLCKPVQWSLYSYQHSKDDCYHHSCWHNVQHMCTVHKYVLMHMKSHCGIWHYSKYYITFIHKPFFFLFLSSFSLYSNMEKCSCSAWTRW